MNEIEDDGFIPLPAEYDVPDDWGDPLDPQNWYDADELFDAAGDR